MIRMAPIRSCKHGNEELLETGIQMVIGQAAMLEEVLVLPLVVYPEWLNRLAELETQAHRNE